MEPVIVLNADYRYLNYISVRRAIALIVNGHVEIIKCDETKEICNIDRSVVIPHPEIIKLHKYIRQIYKNKVPLSKKNVLIRDSNTCQYCGNIGTTIDHIIPKSRNGDNSWENWVTACHECNVKKGNKTPREASMKLIRLPKMPTISEFIQIKLKKSGVDKYLDDLFENL